MNPGDKIISHNDGNEYEVVRFGPRDEIEPVHGVKLLGNALIVKDHRGEKHLLYEWEVSLLGEDRID